MGSNREEATMTDDLTPAASFDLDQQTCLGLLATQRMGRLVVGGNSPTVLLAEFTVVDGAALLIGAVDVDLTDSQWVVFEVEGIDEHQHLGWSVILRGPLEGTGERRMTIVELTGRWVRSARRTPPLDGRAYL